MPIYNTQLTFMRILNPSSAPVDVCEQKVGRCAVRWHVFVCPGKAVVVPLAEAPSKSSIPMLGLKLYPQRMKAIAVDTKCIGKKEETKRNENGDKFQI